MTEENKSVVKSEQGENSPAQSVSDINFKDFFGFEDTVVRLNEIGAWSLKGVVRPFGPGSKEIMRKLGIEILKPEKIHVNGEWHSNPYIEFVNGKAARVWYVKHGIMVAADGIRYMQPELDYIDLGQAIARMALNAEDKLKDCPNAARNCSVERYRAMQEESNDPGSPDWYYVPIDDETGIAFNMNEPGEPRKVIKKLRTDISDAKSYPLRKTNTSTDRRVMENLYPEIFTSLNEKTLNVVNDYGWKVKNAEYTIQVPTKNPIQLQLMKEFGITLRDPDPAVREKKYTEIMGIFNGNIPIKKITAKPLDSENFALDEGDNVSKVDQPENKLKAIPVKISMRDFKKWVTGNWHDLTKEQRVILHKESGAEEGEPTRINKENWHKLYELIMDWAGIAPPESDEITPDDMRKHMLDWIMEQDGKLRFLGEILKDAGQPEDVDFGLIPDKDIRSIYNKFIDQLNNHQERPEDATN